MHEMRHARFRGNALGLVASAMATGPTKALARNAMVRGEPYCVWVPELLMVLYREVCVSNLPRMDEILVAGDLLRDGRYELEELLRAAAGKKVYRALDRVLGFQVALDVFSNNSIMPSGLTVSAWETHVLGRLGDHPNIATVLDHWEDDQIAAMVTRYLTGGSLRDLVRNGREQSGEGLPVEDIFRLSIELAYGLAHIHDRRILYLDLQPRNVLFDEWGTIHLVDFDTAVSLDDQYVSDLSQRAVINYTAPELVDGAVADERADLYSLGATIYDMAAGYPPFGNTREEVLTARRAGLVPSPNRDGIPDGLRDLMFCLLAPEAEQRPASALEVAGRLESLRAAHAEIERLLASTVDVEVLHTVEAFLNAEGATHTRSVFVPKIDLPPDHRLLMQAIMALAETDYRRASIDAGTASEVALASAIHKELTSKGVNTEFIDRTIRTANGLDGLFSLYQSFGNALPVSLNKVRTNLAGVRNAAAHAGRVPSAEEATRAVELAHALVTAAHPVAA
jgi:serine/threonine protein kinase